MFGSILGFLFGKQTNIFNKKGRVEHDLGDKKWEAWNNRLAKNPDYDFRNHQGKKAPERPQQKTN